MKAFVFPGQAAQFEGMGKDMYEDSATARDMFESANDILGFRISDIMFEGSAEDLKATNVTQPAVFLHSIIKARLAGPAFKPDVVAGHSLGEFSALVAAHGLSFAEGLSLVKVRAEAMQLACELQPSTMAAIIGLENELVEATCAGIDDVVVAANYNCPGQIVISGTVHGIQLAVDLLNEAGARNAIVLQVGGAFHSPLMSPAREALADAVNRANVQEPICPIYQNVDAKPHTNPDEIKKNLIDQLTSPVRWTQIMQQMIQDGVTSFTEVGGTGKTLRGFVARIDRKFPTDTL